MCADTVIESLDGARWIIADPVVAAALRERLEESGRDVNVLSMMNESPEALAKAAGAAKCIPSVNVRKALDLGAAPFLLAWLREDPAAACSNVVLAANPELPEFAQFKAYPDGMVMRLAKDEPTGDAALRGLLARCMDKRVEIGEALTALPQQLQREEKYRATAPFRQLAGMIGNNLGVILAKNGMTNEAFNVFKSADAVFPAGHSALLNTASLLKRSPNQALSARVGARLNDLAGRGGPGGMLSLTGGWVMEPEDFYPAGWFNACTGLHASDRPAGADALAAVTNEAVRAQMSQAMNACRALQSGRSARAMTLLSDTDGSEWDPLSLLSAVDLCRRNSEPARAAALALKIAELDDPRAADSALQAAVQLALSGDKAGAGAALAAAGEKVSPATLNAASAMVSLCARDPKAAKESVSGAVGKPDAPEWCAALAEALDAPPGDGRLDALQKFARSRFNPMYGVAAMRYYAWECLISGNLRRAADAAKEVSPYAGEDSIVNYILALDARNKGGSDRAERHFQASLSVSPEWFVLNDYAALLASTGRAALAERFARDAVRMTGGANPAVLDTLGCALMAQKRFAEAAEILTKADALAKGADAEIASHLADARRALEEAERAHE